MTQLLPPDDQPSGLGMITANANDAMADVGEISMTNPAAVALAFFIAGTRDIGPDVHSLRTLVTPESLPAWGDFSFLPEWIGHLAIGTQGQRAAGSDDVHYIGLFADLADEVMQSDGDVLGHGKILSLQRRSDLDGEWRVHGVGDYVLPEEMPFIG
jgi:hypothetical protein